MKADLFLSNFGLLADTPNSIPKLRQAILQLAIQGKLVPQDPQDEPASVLLEIIGNEKNRFMKEGIIKKSKPLPLIDKDKIPFELPKNWEWIRLGEVVTRLGDGIHGTPSYDDKGTFFFINGNNLSEGKIEIKENTKTVSEDEYLKYKKELNSQTVFVSINGTIGNVAFYNSEKIVLGKSVCYFNLFSQIDKQYIQILIKSDYFLKYALALATGSTIKNVSLKVMREFPIPLPPIYEQGRIVGKADQLMALCDELEQRQEIKQECCKQLNKSSIHSLTKANTKEEFTKAWGLINKNFDTLYNSIENVEELRNAILQLAVQGKLVPQNPKDEPASVLLEKMEAEKNRLIKEGRIRKNKPLPPIEKDEIPYELPQGWGWCRLGVIVDYDGAIKVDPKKIANDAWLLELEDIEKDTSKIIRRVPSRLKSSTSTKAVFAKGDVLYGKLRPYLNKVIVADENGYCSTEILPLKIYYGISPKYLMYALKRPDFQEYVNSKLYGTKMPRLRTEDGKAALIPVPPYDEQKRIADKVEHLMILCDELSVQLDQADHDGEELMKSVVHHLAF